MQKNTIIPQFSLDITQTQYWKLLLACPDVPMCIGVSNPPQKHHPPLFCQAPLESANCPTNENLLKIFQEIPPI